MVIQRFQTLFLLVAALLMAAFIFMPFGYSVITEGSTERIVEDWTAYQYLGLVIPAGVCALLLLVDIFLFKQMTLQKTLAWVGMALTLACIGVTVYILSSGMTDITPGVEIINTRWGGGGLLLVAAALSIGLAISRISADQRILRNADRLR